MKIVIDTSTLISLAKIDAIGLLETIDSELICPSDVFEEAVVEAKIHGYRDGEIINGVFKSKCVIAVSVHNKMGFEGISKTDSVVISCAIENKTDYLFSNDTKLARKAELQGIEVRGSPDILLRLFQKNIINEQQYNRFIIELYRKKRISEINMALYLEK